jgi:hypothetical protein
MTTRIKRLIALAGIATACLCGCKTTPTADPYPIDAIIDPVTEETPNVRTE